MHCSWETDDLIEQVEELRCNFLSEERECVLFSADERCDGDYFDPVFRLIVF
jgi:hypothetical protein